MSLEEIASYSHEDNNEESQSSGIFIDTIPEMTKEVQLQRRSQRNRRQAVIFDEVSMKYSLNSS